MHPGDLREQITKEVGKELHTLPDSIHSQLKGILHCHAKAGLQQRQGSGQWHPSHRGSSGSSSSDKGRSWQSWAAQDCTGHVIKMFALPLLQAAGALTAPTHLTLAGI